MINGWNSKYHIKPIIDGDFDFYKITFPTTTTYTVTGTKTVTYTGTKTVTKRDDKEREILQLIENNPYLSAEEIGKHVGLTKRGVRYHLDNLKKKERVRRKGHGKGGSWEIID